jgi:hypothetical protein
MLDLFDCNVQRSARLSGCGRYRYQLWRRWGDGRKCCFVMLNPSTADGEKDDATIRRCVGFARAWEYEQLVVVNLFAFRATDPSELLKVWDPVGPENDSALLESVIRADITICAWGGFADRPRLVDRAAYVAGLLRSRMTLHHLGLTQGGRPKHPVRLPGNLKPQRWETSAQC